MTSHEASFEGPTPGSAADDVVAADPESVARTIVLRKLTAAPQTRAQLETVLARRGVPGEVATRVLDRFEEVNLVDDAAFAALWVESRQRGRGLSRRALRHELTTKGISAEVAAEALEGVSADDEFGTAVALVRRRLRGMSSLAPDVQRRRLLGMLARKGYSGAMASAALREAMSDAAVSGTEMLDDGFEADTDIDLDTDAAEVARS